MKRKDKTMKTKTKKDKITKSMTLGEAIQKYPETAEVLMRNGFHCLGCHMAGFETIAQGAASHGIDLKKLLKDMNDAVK
jgi:hybrid cluster-associated redox disulfide protein